MAGTGEGDAGVKGRLGRGRGVGESGVWEMQNVREVGVYGGQRCRESWGVGDAEVFGRERCRRCGV